MGKASVASVQEDRRASVSSTQETKKDSIDDRRLSVASIDGGRKLSVTSQQEERRISEGSIKGDVSMGSKTSSRKASIEDVKNGVRGENNTHEDSVDGCIPEDRKSSEHVEGKVEDIKDDRRTSVSSINTDRKASVSSVK